MVHKVDEAVDFAIDWWTDQLLYGVQSRGETFQKNLRGSDVRPAWVFNARTKNEAINHKIELLKWNAGRLFPANLVSLNNFDADTADYFEGLQITRGWSEEELAAAWFCHEACSLFRRSLHDQMQDYKVREILKKEAGQYLTLSTFDNFRGDFYKTGIIWAVRQYWDKLQSFANPSKPALDEWVQELPFDEWFVLLPRDASMDIYWNGSVCTYPRGQQNKRHVIYGPPAPDVSLVEAAPVVPGP